MKSARPGRSRLSLAIRLADAGTQLVRICLGAADLQRETFLTAGSCWVGVPADCLGLKLLDAWGRLCRPIFKLLYILLNPFLFDKEGAQRQSGAKSSLNQLHGRGSLTHMGVEWSTRVDTQSQATRIFVVPFRATKMYSHLTCTNSSKRGINQYDSTYSKPQVGLILQLRDPVDQDPKFVITCLVHVGSIVLKEDMSMSCVKWISGWWLGHPSEKYESQLGWLFPIYGKIKNVPNHQPDILLTWILLSQITFACTYHTIFDTTFPPELRTRHVL